MTKDHDDFAFEPTPGLPEALPQGERLLWQGSPNWRGLAVSAFHVRKVALYFALLLAWQLTSAWQSGAGLAEMAILSASITGLALATAGILCTLAFLYARGTIYTLTSKRIVIRGGLALPVTLNLPLALIDTASVNRHAGGKGSIALAVSKPNRIAWLVLWPSVRPWTMNNPQPLLRNLEQVDSIAPLLAKALAADGSGRAMQAPISGIATQPIQPMPSGATWAA